MNFLFAEPNTIIFLFAEYQKDIKQEHGNVIHLNFLPPLKTWKEINRS